MQNNLDRIYQLKAEVMQALAHPIRLAIVECLSDSERSAGEIAECVSAERSNVSRHLGVLLKADIVENRKDGLRMLYRIKTRCVLGFLSCLSSVMRERAEDASVLLSCLCDQPKETRT